MPASSKRRRTPAQRFPTWLTDAEQLAQTWDRDANANDPLSAIVQTAQIVRRMCATYRKRVRPGSPMFDAAGLAVAIGREVQRLESSVRQHTECDRWLRETESMATATRQRYSEDSEPDIHVMAGNLEDLCHTMRTMIGTDAITLTLAGRIWSLRAGILERVRSLPIRAGQRKGGQSRRDRAAPNHLRWLSKHREHAERGIGIVKSSELIADEEKRNPRHVYNTLNKLLSNGIVAS